MAECYYQHHIDYARTWAERCGIAQDVAATLIGEWNANPKVKSSGVLYPNTSRFRGAVAKLIQLVSDRKEIETIDESDERGIEIDPLCIACQRCQRL